LSREGAGSLKANSDSKQDRIYVRFDFLVLHNIPGNFKLILLRTIDKRQQAKERPFG
jgi:hypothetical protein